MDNNFMNTAPSSAADFDGSAGCSITIFDYSHIPDEYNLMAFGKETVSFGRDDTNDIMIASDIVSRKHGHFTVSEGRCYITDDNSTNGIYVNGKRITQVELKDGDSIRIDDMEQSVYSGISMVFSDKNSGADWNSVQLSKDVTTIGRDKSCDLVVSDPKMEEKAAEIRIEGATSYVLCNQGALRDILINSEIMEGERYYLKDEDVFVIGNTKFSYSKGVLYYKQEKSGLSLELVNISKFVHQGMGKDKKILDDTSMLILPGDFVAIVGGSGSGKSTLMNCINGFDKPSTGKVLVNRRDLYENYDEMKYNIGYVPQQDIVHENLTLISMLRYVAKLRLPEGTTRAEREKRIAEVLRTVELTKHKNKLIRKLSGGQKKRASIAVELMSDPGLFFLDEPSSGLDPGTERTLMHTLKRMTDDGKTVIMITHNTNNIHLCDKLIFLGAGGYVAFCGNPADARSFFGIPKDKDLTDAYTKVEEDPKGWEEKFNASPYNNIQTIGELKTPPMTSEQKKERKKKLKKENHKSFLHQFSVLSSRYINLIWNDKMRLLFFLLQGPLIAYLFSFVTVENTFKSYFDAQSMLFCLSCAGIWVGLMNSIQEVCKERNIVRREYMSDVRLSSYICSKLAVQTLLAIIQCGLMLAVFVYTIGKPDKGVIFGNSTIEMMITLVLITVSSSSLGLLVSSLVKNTDRAMVFAPIILIPQLLFSGILFKLEGVTEVLSWICVSRWGMQAFSNTADLNGVLWNGLSLKYKSEDLLQQAYELNKNSLYAHSAKNLLLSWGVMLLTIVVFCFISASVLRSVKNDKR